MDELPADGATWSELEGLMSAPDSDPLVRLIKDGRDLFFHYPETLAASLVERDPLPPRKNSSPGSRL